MKCVIYPTIAAFCLVLAIVMLPSEVLAATPSVEQALKLTPVQPGVDYTRPTRRGGRQVYDHSTKSRRQERLDRGRRQRPDPAQVRRHQRRQRRRSMELLQGRHRGLSRHRHRFQRQGRPVPLVQHGRHPLGHDKNEDGRIDSWKQISAEEVTAEVVAALAERNADRFARVALTRRGTGVARAWARKKPIACKRKLGALASEFRKSAAQAKEPHRRRPNGCNSAPPGPASCRPAPTARRRICGFTRT